MKFVRKESETPEAEIITTEDLTDRNKRLINIDGTQSFNKWNMFYNCLPDGTYILNTSQDLYSSRTSTEDRRVAYDEVRTHIHDFFVSTVFLGIDQNIAITKDQRNNKEPVLWETMYSNELNTTYHEVMVRCKGYAHEARLMHYKTLSSALSEQADVHIVDYAVLGQMFGHQWLKDVRWKRIVRRQRRRHRERYL